MEYQLDGAAGRSNGNYTDQSKDIDMASVTRDSERSDEKLVPQENLDSGSCHKKDTAIGSPLASIASRRNIEKIFLQENMSTSTCHSKDFSISSSDGSIADVIYGEGESVERKPSDITSGTPISDGENLMEQINLARLSIEEKRKLRDYILVQIHDIRASNRVHGLDYEYAKSEERTARKLVTSKRMEIDHLLSIVNKAKNALAVNDVDNQVFNIEHNLQHEAPLMKEGQFIRGTKQLKLLRDVLSSSLGSQDEIKSAIERREDAEKQLKILRKELVGLKDAALRAQVAAFQEGKEFSDVNKQMRVLRLQLGAANDDLQAAYSNWQSLKTLWDTKQFSKCKDDMASSSSNDCCKALCHLCMNEVENFMEHTNTNDKLCPECFMFTRMDSVSQGSHASSSFVDGSPNEKAVGASPANYPSQHPILEPKQEAAAQAMTLDDEQIMEVADESSKRLIFEPPKSELGDGLGVVCGQNAGDEFKLVLNTSGKEVVDELTMTAEDSGNLKDKCRLEELAKANEARERKKRQEKKMQMRKELKAKKDAEQKEKDREKRLRKKEKKKVGADVNDSNSCTASVSSEGGTSESGKDVVLSVDPKKSPPRCKQSKARSAAPPPHVRNRNKKICKRWMLMCLISVLLSIIFWQGNVDVFSGAKLKWEKGIV